jgi:nicotinamidase-related amidase
MTNVSRLISDDILFVFIDLQEKLLTKIPESRQIISRNQLLMEAANVLNLPYLVTTQYRKGLGEVTGPLADKVRNEPLDKVSFSCAGDHAILQKLERSGRNSVIVSGVETHICVLQTSLDLLRTGYEVFVVADAVGARKEIDHTLGLKRMESSGAQIVTSEMVIYEILGRSDSDAFKKILPLIKDS